MSDIMVMCSKTASELIIGDEVEPVGATFQNIVNDEREYEFDFYVENIEDMGDSVKVSFVTISGYQPVAAFPKGEVLQVLKRTEKMVSELTEDDQIILHGDMFADPNSDREEFDCAYVGFIEMTTKDGLCDVTVNANNNEAPLFEVTPVTVTFPADHLVTVVSYVF